MIMVTSMSSPAPYYYPQQNIDSWCNLTSFEDAKLVLKANQLYYFISSKNSKNAKLVLRTNQLHYSK